MYQVKLPYKRMMATASVTPFGVQEIDCPKIYDTPVPNKIICRIDILDILRDRLDATCFMCRDILYALFSGARGYYDCEEIFYRYYMKFPSFRKIVNDAYYYGDETKPLFERVVHPIREEMNAYSKNVGILMHDSGGKFLVATHDILYYSFVPGAKVPSTVGGTTIC